MTVGCDVRVAVARENKLRWSLAGALGNCTGLDSSDYEAGVERPTDVAGDVSERSRMGRYVVGAVGVVLAIAVAAILLKRQVKKAPK